MSRVTVSEDDVVRVQAEEDLRLYGSRNEPLDVVEVDEDAKLTGLPPKRSVTDFEAAVKRPAKVRKKGESRDFNYHAITALDWNNGASPLDAWLNQSALPSTDLSNQQPTKKFAKGDPAALEEEEIKVFRNVHIGISQEFSAPEAMPTRDLLSSMELDTQIFFRNITDRYPVLPSYLAHRLARANHDRAERLRLRRHRTEPFKRDDRDETRLLLESRKVAVEPFAVQPTAQQFSGSFDGEIEHSKVSIRTPITKAGSVKNTEDATKRLHSHQGSTRAVINRFSCFHDGCNMQFPRERQLKKHMRSRKCLGLLHFT